MINEVVYLPCFLILICFNFGHIGINSFHFLLFFFMWLLENLTLHVAYISVKQRSVLGIEKMSCGQNNSGAEKGTYSCETLIPSSGFTFSYPEIAVIACSVPQFGRWTCLVTPILKLCPNQ